jgi:hypothetical protein
LSVLDRALKIASENSDVLTSAAVVYNQFGETNMTILYLQKAISSGASRTSLRDLPNFDNLREDSRLKQLLNVN